MLDFSNEDTQKEYGMQGPVPSGSIVVVQMDVQEPYAERQAQDNRLISVAQSGLRQIYCQFTVIKGEYSDVYWRQNITLPASMQTVSLNPGQEKACRIGGATLKAILLAAGKSQARIESLSDFSGLKFPVKVKLNNRPYESKMGDVFWRNEIATVVTPDMKQYQEVKAKGEIICHDGAVSGKIENGNNGYAQAQSASFDQFSQGASPFDAGPVETDDVPF